MVAWHNILAVGLNPWLSKDNLPEMVLVVSVWIPWLDITYSSSLCSSSPCKVSQSPETWVHHYCRTWWTDTAMTTLWLRLIHWAQRTESQPGCWTWLALLAGQPCCSRWYHLEPCCHCDSHRRCTRESGGFGGHTDVTFVRERDMNAEKNHIDESVENAIYLQMDQLNHVGLLRHWRPHIHSCWTALHSTNDLLYCFDVHLPLGHGRHHLVLCLQVKGSLDSTTAINFNLIWPGELFAWDIIACLRSTTFLPPQHWGDDRFQNSVDVSGPSVGIRQ